MVRDARVACAAYIAKGLPLALGSELLCNHARGQSRSGCARYSPQPAVRHWMTMRFWVRGTTPLACATLTSTALLAPGSAALSAPPPRTPPS